MKAWQGLLILVTILTAALYPIGLMFEYCLGFWIKKDVPFWIDILGGVATNAILFAAWVVTLICDYCGYVPG